MSRPFPFLFISSADRAQLRANKSPPVSDLLDVNESTITLHGTFDSNFSLTDYSLTCAGKLIQLTLTATKVGGSSLLNTVYQIGSLDSESFYPPSNVSGLFPYGGGITDVGQIQISDTGVITIRTGNNAAIANSSSFTMTILYLKSV